MCTVSMVMDHYQKTLPQWPKPPEWIPGRTFTLPTFDLNMENWKRDIEQRLSEMENLIKAAHAYDEKNNEPNCEMDEKRLALKKIAEEMGIEIKFL